jgi:hypothetical protein
MLSCTIALDGREVVREGELQGELALPKSQWRKP